MLAVAGGHVDAVSLLLEREANVNMANKHGLTALHLGVSSQGMKMLCSFSELLFLFETKRRSVSVFDCDRNAQNVSEDLALLYCDESRDAPK